MPSFVLINLIYFRGITIDNGVLFLPVKINCFCIIEMILNYLRLRL